MAATVPAVGALMVCSIFIASSTMSACPGNPSLITGEEESDYYPFGGERVLCDRGIGNNYKFTGKERDSETGLDEFGARYYSSFYGRFTIPDWADAPTAVPYAKALYDNIQRLKLDVQVITPFHGNRTTDVAELGRAATQSSSN